MSTGEMASLEENIVYESGQAAAGNDTTSTEREPEGKASASVKGEKYEMRESRGFTIRKLTFTAMLAGLSFVLSTFVCFPHMAPFQHLCNVIGAVFVGPFWNFAAALLTGSLRMMTGRDIQAVIGAVIGAFLGGFLYRKTHKLWAAWIGEVIGTGVLSAIAAYPVLRIFYGFPKYNPFYLVPFYTPSAAMGATMGFVLIAILKKSGLFGRMLFELNKE
jgi:energy coupling factor transporter S component ThiW